MTEIKFTKEQVMKVSKLAKLDLTEEEIALLATRFTDTLQYMNVINELDTSNVEETFQVTGLTNIYQNEKSPRNTLTFNKALANAYKRVKNYFATKGVFDRS